VGGSGETTSTSRGNSQPRSREDGSTELPCDDLELEAGQLRAAASILLLAIRKHYYVVILALIGDYSNWAPIMGREKDLIEGTTAICKDYGAELRYLDFKSHCFGVSFLTKRAVADVQPDVALLLWRHDYHDDHGDAAHLSEIALRFASPLLENSPVTTP
jgi:hypothetical protein